MQVPHSWLQELTGLDWSATEMADRLTMAGTACEQIDDVAAHLDRVVVGRVESLRPHPNADKLRLATVSTGGATDEIVCGAPNVAVGQMVAVAQLGAELVGGLTIKAAKIRGVESRGMICSQAELGLSDDQAGIWVLPEDVVVGQPVAEALSLNDSVLHFELTPNRADSMSVLGIARDLAALSGETLRYPTRDLHQEGDDLNQHFSIDVADTEACPRFTVRVIRDVTIGPSPWWLQRRLLLAGVRPISNVVDVTNYVMLEYGNPSHAFDLDKLGTNKIGVRWGQAGERVVTLDGKERATGPEILVVTNGDKAVSVAGVIGGASTEISDETTNICLEMAYWNPGVVRRCRKKLEIVTDASQRFEKGADPNAIEAVSAYAAQLIADLGGGTVQNGFVDTYPRPIQRPRIELRTARCGEILGYPVTTERITEILTGLEFDVSTGDPLVVDCPTWRHDMEREIDLIEEVGRINGYDIVPDVDVAYGPLVAPRHRIDIFRDELRTQLCAGGFDECMGHGLGSSQLAEKLAPERPLVRIVNPVSEDLDIARNNLYQHMLESIGHNINHRNLDLRLFEIGRIYLPPANDAGEGTESLRLVIGVAGEMTGDWRNPSRSLDFYDLSGALIATARHFRWPELTLRPEAIPWADAGASFAIRVGDCLLGAAGRVDAQLARQFDIKLPVYLAELTLDSLVAAAPDVKFAPLPRYPASSRDIAAVVSTDVPVGEMLAKATEAAGPLLESIRLFDLFTGKQLGEGKQSVGIRLDYRAEDRSLTSDEVDAAQKAVIAALQAAFTAEIREN